MLRLRVWLLRLTPGTAKRWIDGDERAGRVYEPVVRQERTGSPWVTWGELVETRLLSEFRSSVPMIKLRPVVEWLRERVDRDYPLAYARPFLAPEGKELLDGSYRVRILHALNKGDAPPPGTNSVRRAFYRNPPLGTIVPLFGEANDRLLILWQIDPKSAAAGFRVVRPIGEWKWGAYQATDLDFPLPQTADELADLAFEPTDEDLGLELPCEEEGDNDAGGITG